MYSSQRRKATFRSWPRIDAQFTTLQRFITSLFLSDFLKEGRLLAFASKFWRDGRGRWKKEMTAVPRRELMGCEAASTDLGWITFALGARAESRWRDSGRNLQFTRREPIHLPFVCNRALRRQISTRDPFAFALSISLVKLEHERNKIYLYVYVYNGGRVAFTTLIYRRSKMGKGTIGMEGREIEG